MTTISIQVSETGTLTNRQTVPLTTAGPSLWARLTRMLQSTWCVVNGGHYKVLHTEPDRLALRCVACGHTSPGWAVGSPRLARRTPAKPDQLRVRRPVAA